MKLFVTGGTGFLGSHFINTAIGNGHEVVASRRNLNPVTADESKLNLTWVKRQLNEISPEDFDKVDVLVHFAAVGVSPQHASWEELFQVNVTDSLALWIRALESGVRRLVICGSCHEYGRAGERYDFIPPDAPLEPTTGYGASKAAASLAALGLATEYSAEVMILRPFNCFGDGQNEKNLWPMLRSAALSGNDLPMTTSDQIRDFVPVSFVSERFLDACTCKHVHPGNPMIYNVGTGKPKTVASFAEYWWSKWNAKGRLLIGAVPNRKNEIKRFVPLVG